MLLNSLAFFAAIAFSSVESTSFPFTFGLALLPACRLVGPRSLRYLPMSFPGLEAEFWNGEWFGLEPILLAGARPPRYACDSF